MKVLVADKFEKSGIEGLKAAGCEVIFEPDLKDATLTEAGVPQMECLNLEELSRDKLYEFAFIGAPIRLRGSTGSPIRPLAFPLRA